MSGAFRLDLGAVRRFFSGALPPSAVTAKLQAGIGDELLERLQFFHLEPRVIVDLGCGTGALAAQLRRRFPRARVVAVDSSYKLARAARRRQRFWRRFDCVCADAHALPLAAQSVDLVLSNLLLQWSDDPARLFAQVARVLRPGGLFLYSTLGPETLNELRRARAGTDAASQVSVFEDMPQLGAAMARSGLSEPVIDRELRQTHHPDMRDLLIGVSMLGARPEARSPKRSLTERRRWLITRDLYDATDTPTATAASWEIIYGAGFATGASPNAAAGDSAEIAVPVGAIGVRGRPT